MTSPRPVRIEPLTAAARRSSGRRTGRLVVSTIVVFTIGVVFLWPMVRQAWETARTGVAPGSWVALRADAAGAGIAVVGATSDGDTYEPGAWLQPERNAGWKRIGAVGAAGQVLDVTHARGRLIAVGSVDGRPAALERPDEDDGRWKPSWTLIGPGIEGELVSVATGAGGLDVVAAGSERRPEGSRARMVLWLDDRWLPATDEQPSAASVAAHVGTEPMVGGTRLLEPSRSRATVWSWDGEVAGWMATELPVPDGARRSMVVGVAGAADLVVAVGTIDLSPAAWVREDGAWAFAGLLPDSDVPGRRATAIARSGDGATFLAVGQQTGLGDVQTPLAWSSADGRTWRTVGVGGTGGTGLVDAFADARGRLVAVGNRTVRKQSSAVVYDLDGSVLAPRSSG